MPIKRLKTTGTAPTPCSSYNDAGGILGTRDIVKLPEVREVVVNEDDHKNMIIR